MQEVARSPAAANTSPMIEVQLDQLEDELRLVKEQQAAWGRYAARVSSLMEDVRRAREPVGASGGNALEQLDRIVATARLRVDALEGIAEAARELYPLLTPAQKAIADRRVAALVAPSVGLTGAAGLPRR